MPENQCFLLMLLKKSVGLRQIAAENRKNAKFLLIPFIKFLLM